MICAFFFLIFFLVTPENIESLFTDLMKLLNQDITVSETENFETHPLKKIKSDDDIL